MAPTEAELLTNYLIQPSSLTSITTLDQFKALFPRPLQASPQVRSLYRDLQAQRNAVLDHVAADIEAEVKGGNALRREVIRAKREAAREDVDGEIEMERALFGEVSGAKSARHNLASIIPELDGATGALETEMQKLAEEEAALLESVKQTIGGLSDLRYGKFANGDIKDEIIDGLKNVEAACEGKS
ncbi:Cnl2/NKP2 family protein-domain-containing protein [Ilyonectria robusta]|uniref:Cnl2/NKP2 family protein-domain-containing protein n=1 Tax=Ilyonectria robusta TaxID=1079257 RepID=UPI001E8D9A81|nr:Cnl2/NKP2 family protein-domain-containing protein [Ilyonectria robusta]KAH8706507.1 Cnl2/NKP2 family protein-domain-containing protein [Ilyonectria robusta]